MNSKKKKAAGATAEDEQALLKAFDSGVLAYGPPTTTEQSEARLAARNTLKRDKRMNIRVSSMDMLSLQTKAAKLGMPYQTLVSSILHQYLTGRLKSSDV